jgi:uncharacterized protein YdhG (YjbR/CyaY superfamily)
MQSQAITVDTYLDELPKDRKETVKKLYTSVKKNLPKGFVPIMQYGMISFVVPHKLYPPGYHCKPTDALPFIGIAAQKNFIAIYHMGIYANPTLLQWFTDAYTKADLGKLDMGKSCIRFKKAEQIPFTLIAELSKKITVEEWIACYEANYKASKKSK